MAGDGNEEAAVNIHIRIPNGATFSVAVNLNSSVEDLKSVAAERCGIPAELQRLIYKGRVMQGGGTLRSFGVEENERVFLIRASAGAAAPLALGDDVIRGDPVIENVLLTFPNTLNSLYANDPDIRARLDLNPALLRRIKPTENVNLQSTSSAAAAAAAAAAGGGDERIAADMLNSASIPQGCNPSPSSAAAASAVVLPAEEIYATQLSELQELGFFDTQENIRALISTEGNVQAAVQRLLQD